MRAPSLTRLFQAGTALAITSMLFGATAGFAAAAPGEHGRGHDGSGAASSSNSGATDARPGWGCGDKNHVHTGPPGLGSGAVSPCGTQAEAAAGVHLVISAPSSVAAGVSFSFTVTAEDSSNATLTSFADSLHFTSSDVSATLPGDSTLTNGTGSFSATLRTMGNQTITATDMSKSSIAATATIGVGNTAMHFVVSAPSNVTVGNGFNFTVTAEDASNNTMTSYGGMVHFTSSDSQASLPVDSTLSSGTGTFSATLKTSGNQTITATDTVTSAFTGSSNTIAVAPAGATHFAVSAPSTATHGTALSFTVTAQDQFNNTATSYGGTVHFTSSDGSASLPANSGLTSGSGSFSATINATGNQTITATDTSNSSITGTSGTISVS